MNECEQLHPLLRGYLGDTLSARDRRMVARHLNLCASARKELDRLRGGNLKSPAVSANPPKESWDFKALRWLFKGKPKETTKTPEPVASKRAKPSKESSAVSSSPNSASAVVMPDLKRARSSTLIPVLGVLFLFVGLVFLTHFIQNAGQNSLVKGTQRWLSRHGITVLGTPSLDLVLDLTNQPQWGGVTIPIAIPYQEVIEDQAHYDIFWHILEPGLEPPAVDFTKNQLVILTLGPRAGSGHSIHFKRMENYADRTVLWYDDAPPVTPASTRSWVLQMIPKPAQQPVLIQKIP
ncbi:MAG TPA: hypothetical protein VHE12_10850 [bacterium]|nr:hypothetical protein [bacterium]